ncbi:MAG: UPF0324 membrane protein [Planctomycetaceae bacterium]|nr:MAG: UPF0324 membrane protein [Planctomycetaceae bacterium]
MSDVAPSQSPEHSLRGELFRSDDWWANWCGVGLLLAAGLTLWLSLSADTRQLVVQGKAPKLTHPWQSILAQPTEWDVSLAQAFYAKTEPPRLLLTGWLITAALLGGVVSLSCLGRGLSLGNFWRGFPFLFLLTLTALVLAQHKVIRHYNLEYVLWALLLGLLISNTVGTPHWLRSALCSEFYIKTGLVLLGAEIVFHRLLALGIPGIFVSWVVTPIVLVGTYLFGQYGLRFPSRSLNLVISADMSVCGVSAAIATAAACKAKKEELSLAIGLSLTFTAVMMVLMPMAIKALGMDEVLGGAWIGGTIDSTGAVAAAGALLGPKALEVASTVKMIQNILIGVIALAVSVYWTGWVERSSAGWSRLDLGEIWRRFPKFVLGFIGLSVLCSWGAASLPGGDIWLQTIIKGATSPLRSWFFCLAFVSIGLETRFRELIPYLRSGKPLVLYVCGQAFNLALTLGMAWLMFHVVFREQVYGG